MSQDNMAVDELDAQGFFTKMMRGITRRVANVTDDVEEMAVEDIEEPERYSRQPIRITRKEMLSDVYKMDYPRRGKAVIINNKEFSYEMQKEGYGYRSGTDVDCTAIGCRLKALGFDVDRYHNVTCEEIMKIFAGVAKEDHADADCFAAVLLSHGEQDHILGTDGKLNMKEIFQFFRANNCPSLAGKPKMFFIQACRGRQFDRGVNINTADAKRTYSSAFEENEVIRIPNEADFLLSYSTVPGYYSWRNSVNGSWYIQGLVYVLDKMGTTIEVQKLLTQLNKLVAYSSKYMSNTAPKDPSMHGMKQIPSFTSMLTKDLYFVPKQL